jgi:hypothetical protein
MKVVLERKKNMTSALRQFDHYTGSENQVYSNFTGAISARKTAAAEFRLGK